MGNYGIISSIESLPVPEGPHVRDFDDRQKTIKQAALAAKAKDVSLAARENTTVMRQMSPNLSVPLTITPPKFQSVADFVDAYKTTDKAIAACTNQFVSKAGEAKKAQDDILPHLALMQSLLSKKGSYHHLIIEARKNGQEVPWWTDYYEQYRDRLSESLRTMQRRIAKYHKDPSLPEAKRGNGNGSDKLKHLSQLEHKLLGTATSVHEALTDINAGRIEDAVKKLKENLPTQDCIDEHLERGVKPTLANPDGKTKPQPDDLEQQPGGAQSIAPLTALPTGARVPQRTTYSDWEQHLTTTAPQYELKYFEEASGNFMDRYGYAFQGSAFKKILAMLKDKPLQVLSNAHDFAQLAVVLRGAADNLNLLAAAIATALSPPPESEPEPTPEPGRAPGEVEQQAPPPSGAADENVKEFDTPEDPGPEPQVQILSEDFINEYLKRNPYAQDTNGRIGQYSYIVPKLAPPVPIGSYYLYQGNGDGGKWHVCQLAARGNGWREKLIATYEPRHKQKAVNLLKGLVKKESPGVVRK